MNGVVRTDEQLQHDSPTRHARLSTEIQWRDVVLNYSALPPAIFPDNCLGANQDSEGSRMCFIDSEGQRHYANIVLSDQYMLVSLPSESATDRLVWDSYGVHIPARFNGPLSAPCFVDPREACPDPTPVSPSVAPRQKRKSPAVSSPKKRSIQGTKTPSKKLCTARKHTPASQMRPRLIGPTTRGNPQSERAPTSGTFDLDFVATLDSPASSSRSLSPVSEMACWIDGCPRSFASLEDLEAHHNMCHQGQITLICPFRDSCSHTTTRQGEMKRHIKSVQHLGGASLLCPNRCTIKTFSRLDALRRHLKSCPRN
ncbi:hypothetical protein F5050DRAFT_416334 [Lentinula boryana]|uniref:C2H2-type domain-containing protein n=1 Tax=Lentinula boryana TaxID=40481 RepID=A0ABQ8Q8D8_9AGAR|nr:hypothetical protein F5050DRAFT_416334 [Lentinula boryana]